MQLGICTSLDNAATLAAAGVDFVEDRVGSLLVPRQDEAAFAPHFAQVKSALLPVRVVNIFLPNELSCTGPSVDLAALLRYGDTVFRRAAQCGIQLIVFGSGGARKVPEGFSRDEAKEQFVALLHRLGPLAQQHGITVVVEPINRKECNFINSLAEGAELVVAAQHDHIRLLADIYHMRRDNEPASEIVRFGHLIQHVHVAENEKRTPPGVKGDDFRPFFRALKDVNYTGALSIECSWSNLATEAGPAIQTLKGQLC